MNGRLLWFSSPLEEIFTLFIQQDGLSCLSTFIQDLQNKGKKIDTIVIGFMDAFSFISMCYCDNWDGRYASFSNYRYCTGSANH